MCFRLNIKKGDQIWSLAAWVRAPDQTAMLTTKRFAGVTVHVEVSVRNLSCAGNKARKGIHPGFEIHGRYHQNTKTAVTVAYCRGYYPSKNLRNSDQV